MRHFLSGVTLVIIAAVVWFFVKPQTPESILVSEVLLLLGVSLIIVATQKDR